MNCGRPSGNSDRFRPDRFRPLPGPGAAGKPGLPATGSQHVQGRNPACLAATTASVRLCVPSLRMVLRR